MTGAGTSLSKWLLALLLLPAGYLVMRVSALSAEIDRLEGALARLEAQDPQVVVAPPPVSGGGPGVIVIGPDAGLSEEALARVKALSRPAVRGGASPDDVRRARKLEDERILDVLAEERDRILDRHLAFHKQRWLESRETALDRYGEAVQLTDLQYSRLEELARGEVDRMMELLRDARYRDHPEAFVQEWDATLRATDNAVRSILTAKQREAWEEGRAFERAVFFPWLDQ